MEASKKGLTLTSVLLCFLLCYSVFVNYAQATTIINGGFESGYTGWTETQNTGTAGLWVGDNSATFGYPAYEGTNDFWSGGYGFGSPNTNSVRQDVLITAGGTQLSFWYSSYRPSDDDRDFRDYAYVGVDGTEIWTYDFLQANDTNPNWLNQLLDLSPYVGSTVSLEFGAISTGDLTGNLRFDDIQAGTPIPEPTTMLLLGTGLVGVAGAARRKKKNQA